MKKISIVMVLVLLMAIVVGCEKDSQASQAKISENKSFSGTIRVVTNLPDRYLNEAAQRFAAIHPEVKIEVKEYTTQNETHLIRMDQARVRYITNINTELMSGKGPDIISVSGLPYKKYISHNMFVNLDDLIKSDPNYEAQKYYKNLFDAVKVKDGLYTMPINYSYILLGSNIKINANDREWNWSELVNAALSDKNKKWKYLYASSDEDLFYSILRQNYNVFVNDDTKSANFRSQEFINLLNMCKDLSDKGYIRKSTVKPTGGDMQQTLLRDFLTFSIYDLASTETSMNTIKYLYRYPSVKKGSGFFNSETLLAINNASPHKDIAWEFLKFTVSDNMQSSPALSGFPVNRAAYKERVANEMSQFRQDKRISLPQIQRDGLIQKYARINESAVQDFKVCSYADYKVLDIVKREAHPFFTGDVNAASVSQNIHNKVNTYLKE